MLRGQGSQNGLPLLLCDLGQMPASLWPQFTLPWKAIGFHHLWGSDLVVDPSKNERAGGMTELRGGWGWRRSRKAPGGVDTEARY